MDEHGVVVHASSFTKTVCPGVRVGYLVGPPHTIAAIAKNATNHYISPSMVSQAIVHQFCASGAIDRSIKTVRDALGERVQALADALRTHLPQARFNQPDGGYFLWVELGDDVDGSRVFAEAADRGVAVVKGSDFIIGGGETSGAVVNALGIRHLRIGWELAPGVAWSSGDAAPDSPVGAVTYDVVLKSGNFGAPDLFTAAWKAIA
jgi:DNA-binding transcriptional MocR family regulator